MAQQLLSRYGVLTREVAGAEGIYGGFSAVYDVLKALEDAGRDPPRLFRRRRRRHAVRAAGRARADALAARGAGRTRRSSSWPPPIRQIPFGTMLKWPGQATDGEAAGRGRDAHGRRAGRSSSTARSPPTSRAAAGRLLAYLPDDEPQRSAIGRPLARAARDAWRARGGLLIAEINGVPAAGSSARAVPRRSRVPPVRDGLHDARASMPVTRLWRADRGDRPAGRMPEGDTIFRAARTLQRALAGKPVVAFRIGASRSSTRVHEDAPITGRTVERVSAAGKHVLMDFSGDLVLRTHMRMNGSWHIYRPGERWQRRRRDMRDRDRDRRLRGRRLQHPGGRVDQGERDSRRHEELRKLGPDLLGEDFDAAEATRRLRERAGHRDRRRAAQPARHGRHRQRLQVRGAVRLPRRSVSLVADADRRTGLAASSPRRAVSARERHRRARRR